MTDGGFHGSPGRNYTEIGDVILDDSTLILQALGQVKIIIGQMVIFHYDVFAIIMTIPK